MAKVELSYINRQGRTKTLSVNHTATRIEFTNKGIASIDLSPIRECIRLRDFLIYGNELVELDLTPLQGCPLLRTLVLRDNRLREIDLSPIRESMELSRLDLRENQLQSLDLEPLANHQGLDKFQLEKNPLLELDISPLLTCRGLKEVTLDRHLKLKASRSLAGAVRGPMTKYRNRIVWYERQFTPTSTQKPIQAVSSNHASNMALGVLKSVPRITMQELTRYTDMSVEDTRDLVFLLVGEGKVSGRYEPSTDEFISLDAVQTVKELRSDEIVVQRCQYCGSPLPRRLIPGDRIACEACGQTNEA